jgi:hypothetical protein
MIPFSPDSWVWTIPGEEWVEVAWAINGLPVSRTVLTQEFGRVAASSYVAISSMDVVPCFAIGNNAVVELGGRIVLGQSVQVAHLDGGTWSADAGSVDAWYNATERTIRDFVALLVNQFAAGPDVWLQVVRAELGRRAFWGVGYLDEPPLLLSGELAREGDLFLPQNIDLFLQCVLALGGTSPNVFWSKCSGDLRNEWNRVFDEHRERRRPVANDVSADPDWIPLSEAREG